MPEREISRCRAARDRAADRSARTCETTPETTSRGYSTPSATSSNAPLTTFLVGTRAGPPVLRLDSGASRVILRPSRIHGHSRPEPGAGRGPHGPRAHAGHAQDAALESGRAARRAALHLAELGPAARPRPGHGRRGDRRRRVADRPAHQRALRRRAAVAGHALHRRPGLLQHGDQPLHALHRRADLHGQVPPAAGPRLLAVRLPAARLRLGVPVPRGQRGHAGGGGDPGPPARLRAGPIRPSSSSGSGITDAALLQALALLELHRRSWCRWSSAARSTTRSRR